MKLLKPTTPITPFSGVPKIKQTAKPSFMAQVRAGIIEPKDGLDMLLFGVAPISPTPLSRRIE